MSFHKAQDAQRDFSLTKCRPVGIPMTGSRCRMWVPVREIRVRDEAGAYRILYLATFLESVYVLHAFQKKTRKTPKSDLKTARDRYKYVIGQRKQR